MSGTNPIDAPATGAPTPRRCGTALASLICGIAGPCTLGICGIIGLILGIVSLSKIKKSGGQLTGKNLGIAGIVVSAIGLPFTLFFVLPLLVAILVPAFAGAIAGANAASAMNAGKELGIAALDYGMINRTFPPANTWPDVLAKEYKLSPEILAGGSTKGGRMFAMNARLDDTPMSSVRQPGYTVMFFECEPGSPPSGGPELLPLRPRYGGCYIIVFTDRHVMAVRPEDIGTLVWDPAQEKAAP